MKFKQFYIGILLVPLMALSAIQGRHIMKLSSEELPKKLNKKKDPFDKGLFFYL